MIKTKKFGKQEIYNADIAKAVDEYEEFIKENKYITIISVNVIEELEIILLTYKE